MSRRAEAVFAPAPSAPSPAAPAPVNERPGTLVDPNRKLQQGDQLSFRIEEDHEPAAPLAIAPTGHVTVEPVGQVKIVGLTTAQATAEIKRRLESEYYYTATVRLSLDRVSVAASGTVYLSGEVARTGALPIYVDQPLTVSQAIMQGGGWGKWPDKKKVMIYRTAKNGETQQFEVNVRDIIERGRVDLDILLQHSDRVFVKQTFVKY